MNLKTTFFLYLFLHIVFIGCQPKQVAKPVKLKSAMSYYAQAIQAFEASEMILAISKIDSAKMVRPNLALFHFTTGQFYEKMSVPDSAVMAYEIALKNKSFYPDAWERLQHLYQQQGNYRAAIRMLNNLIVHYPDSLSFEENIAECFLLDKKPRLALAKINALQNRGRYSVNAARIRGIANFEIGNMDAALKDLLPVIDKDPPHFLAFKSLGLAYYQMGKIDLGINYLNRALLLDRTDAQIYLYRSLYFEQRHKPAAALEQIRFAEQLDAGNVKIQIQFANLELQLGDTMSAKKRLQDFIRQYTNCWECYKYLGIIADEAGEIESALENYQIYLNNVIHRDAIVEQRLKDLGSN